MARARVSNTACKVTMAVTGVLFAAFVLVHMFGNLKVYQGADAFNGYAAWLRMVGYPLLPQEGVLWMLRIVLCLALVFHVGCGLTLWWRGRRARGAHRRKLTSVRARAASWMAPTGVLLLAFVVVHLLDLTTGHLAAGSFRGPDQAGFHAYANLVASFQRPAYATLYAVVMAALGVHLAQGLWSVLHDLGGTAPRLRRAWWAVAILVATALTIVNASIPIAVQAGWLS